ncbi:MAG: creatininase family protein [Phycisphaerae bacterium]|nr:creatininase family protein [Phycisphaerae bacterium]
MKLDEMTWPQVEGLGDDVVALLPIAATEQHGHHLPLQVDRRITEAIAERLEAERSDWLALAPVLWFGASHHHMTFPGTMSVPNGVYIEVLLALIDNLASAGFKRICLLNGHGGNIVPMQDALTRTRHRLGGDAEVHLVGCTYWMVAGDAMRTRAGMETANITHACEYETSMMLHLAGDLVHVDRAKVQRPALSSEYYDVGFHEPSRVFAAFNMDQLTSGLGGMGRPELATAAKGAKLIDTVVAEVGKFLDEFRTWAFLPGGRR